MKALWSRSSFFVHSEEEPVAESEPDKPGGEQQQHSDAALRGHGRAAPQHHVVQKWSSSERRPRLGRGSFKYPILPVGPVLSHTLLAFVPLQLWKVHQHRNCFLIVEQLIMWGCSKYKYLMMSDLVIESETGWSYQKKEFGGVFFRLFLKAANKLL